MADTGSNLNKYGALTPVANFLRDFGTPITILLFIGLVYTGYLHSPLTDIDNSTRESPTEHKVIQDQNDRLKGIIEQGIKNREQENQDINQNLRDLKQQNHDDAVKALAAARTTCRALLRESQRFMCDDTAGAESDSERWGLRTKP